MANDTAHMKKKAFEKGLDLLDRGNYEKAIEKFEEAISLDYMDVPSHVFRARTLLLLEDYDNVEKELKELESISPQDENFLILKIRYYYKIEEYDTALRESESAQRLYPRNGEIRFQKSMVLEELNRYDEALKEINLAISFDNTDPDFYQKRGDILAKLNHKDEALNSFDIAINMDQKNSFRYVGKATAFAMFNDYENAVKLYDRAIAADPEDVDAHQGKYLMLKELKNYDAALQELHDYAQLDPDMDVIEEYAILHILLGRYQEAYNYIIVGAHSYDEPVLSYARDVLQDIDDVEAIFKFLDSMITRVPDDLDLKHLKISELKDLNRIDEADQVLELLEHDNFYYHFQKASLLNKKHKYSEALSEYDRALAYRPDELTSSFVHTVKGTVFMIIREYDNAIAEFDESIRLTPDNLEPKLAKIDALKTMKNYAGALELINAVIPEYPDNEELLYNRIYILKKLERYDEALTYCDALINKDPDLLDSYLLKAEIFEELNRFDESLKLLEFGITKDPQEPVWYLNKAMVLGKMQRYDDAEREYDRAIKIDTSSASYIAKFFMYMKLNNLDEAKKLVDEAFTKYPEDPYLDFAEIELLERTGMLDKAIETCSTHVAAHPDSVELNIIYALLLAKTQKSGIEQLEHALSSQLIEKIEVCNYLSDAMNQDYFSEEDKNIMKSMSERFCA